MKLQCLQIRLPVLIQPTLRVDERLYRLDMCCALPVLRLHFAHLGGIEPLAQLLEGEVGHAARTVTLLFDLAYFDRHITGTEFIALVISVDGKHIVQQVGKE